MLDTPDPDSRAEPSHAVGASRPDSSHRLASLSTAMVIIAAFGPYTPVQGVRTEQLAIYSCLLLGLPWCLPRLRMTHHGVAVLGILGIYIGVATIGVFSPASNPYEAGQLLGGADNLIRPGAVVVLAPVWLSSGADRVRLIHLTASLVVAVMCANAILAFVESRIDIGAVLRPFWSSTTNDIVTRTVAGNAAQLGRFTGIINQPVEAGTLYGIALLAALYLWRSSRARLSAAFALLTAGGIVTVSKIFLVVALPVAIWQLVTLQSRGSRRTAWIVLSTTVFGAILFVLLLPQWSGADFLARLVSPQGDYIAFYSAGRFGTNSSLSEVAQAVMASSPITGFGLRGAVVAYDNGWIQSLVFAGLIGAMCYTATLFILVASYYWTRKRGDSAETRLGGGLVILAIGASFGFPALTGNRVTAILWTLLGLTLLVNIRSPPALGLPTVGPLPANQLVP